MSTLKRFRVRLPLRQHELRRPDLGILMRVLLIEDDGATARSIELMLKSESFNV
jgi:hypothetical protein